MLYKPVYTCDLHTHTNRSDGNDSYIEIINKAVSYGMKVIAITDHDIVPLEWFKIDGKCVKVKEYALKRGIHVLLGVEFSCDTFVDDVHIVGLECNWNSTDIKFIEENMKRSKINAYKKLTEELTKNGFSVNWDELVSSNSLKDQQDIQKKHIFEFIAKKGYTANWYEAKLMVKQDPAYNIRRKKVDPVRIIKVIHDAGGYAILAHPYLIDDQIHKGNVRISREAYIKKLISSGLDGIEAAYPYSKTSYKGDLSSEQIEKQIVKMYSNQVKIISGGSDYHNDGKKGEKDARILGEKGVSWDYFKENLYLGKLV